MPNPFLDRAAKTANLSNSHRRSKKQEASLAKTLGGTLTPASGSRDVKGDIRLKGIARLECKTTRHLSFSVTRKMIDTIETAAVSAGEMPVIIVEFHDGFGKNLQSIALCPLYVLETLLANQKEKP